MKKLFYNISKENLNFIKLQIILWIILWSIFMVILAVKSWKEHTELNVAINTAFEITLGCFAFAIADSILKYVFFEIPFNSIQVITKTNQTDNKNQTTKTKQQKPNNKNQKKKGYNKT